MLFIQCHAMPHMQCGWDKLPYVCRQSRYGADVIVQEYVKIWSSGHMSVQESEGNILDDEVLINTLNNSKLTAGLCSSVKPAPASCQICKVL